MYTHLEYCCVVFLQETNIELIDLRIRHGQYFYVKMLNWVCTSFP